MLAVNTRQLRLPKVRRTRKRKTNRKSPQPRVSRYRKIKRFEILHRPFDLKFRGTINQWLIRMEKQKDIDLSQVLNESELQLISLYFYPQHSVNKWLNQEEVLQEVELSSKKKLRAAFVKSLIKIWQTKV